MGVHGYGARHVVAALGLARRGRAELVGIVDPRGGPVVRDGAVLPEADLPPRAPSLDALLTDTAVDVVAVATPLHTHLDLARTALAAGCDVLLEKPPVTGRDQLAQLLAAEAASRGSVQVGFQALGSLALPRLAAAVAQGCFGDAPAMTARGSWTRDVAYYARAPWAGRRTLGGVDVVDGALTNPFAHAVMDLLHLAGMTGAADVARVEVDLLHAHAIEADDTAALRVTPTGAAGPTAGAPVVGAFTLAGPGDSPPWVEVRGPAGSARLLYDRDEVQVIARGTAGTAPPGALADLAGGYGRTDLLEDLLAHRTAREVGADRPLLAPLSVTAGFVEVAEAVRRTTPRAVDPAWVRWHGQGSTSRPEVVGVDVVLDAVVADGQLFAAAGAPWA